MKKFLLIITLLLLTSPVLFSQTKKIDDLYLDYTQVRNSPDRKAAKEKALALIARSAELNEKQIANVNFHLAGLYEENKEPELAVPHYEKVIKIVPGYYVPYRALAFINLKKCDALGRKVSAAAQAKNVALYESTFKEYKKQVLFTLPFFEKAQACDEDDNTLKIITSLYNSIKEPQQLTTLGTRLKAMSQDCVTLLDE